MTVKRIQYIYFDVPISLKNIHTESGSSTPKEQQSILPLLPTSIGEGMGKAWKDIHLGEEALGGLSAGIVGTVIGFPLDTVKTRMQTGMATSSNILQVARSVAKEEGTLGLYKGIAPPLISLSILGTLTFGQYSYFQEVYQANPGWDGRNFLAGISCSPVAGVVSTIENLVKVSCGR